MKILISLLFVLFSLNTIKIVAQSTESFFLEADEFFSTHVSDGNVDYEAIHLNSESLSSVLEKAETVEVSMANANDYQAFWINAYNLSVIKGIIDNYPLRSPLDKKGFFDKIEYKLGGHSITLNDIENKMLRRKFDDARFHFVLVCGAKGCPPIIAEAYTPDKLDKLLEEQTIKAINNSSFIRVTKKKLTLSEIFKWYKEDFVNEGQSEIDFLNKYRTTKIPSDVKISYYSYDWRLNSK